MVLFFPGILQKGDGGWLDFRDLPAVVTRSLGNGLKRDPRGKEEDGSLARESPLLGVVGMASAPDGSVYVGDRELVRRVRTDGTVTTVMDLG